MHRKSIKETAIQNQPTFSPAYDAAGNQTLIRTATGTWNVQYNADSRPVSFQQGDRRITSVYDYMGRRIEKTTSNNSGLTKRLRYIYHGYVQIAEIDATDETTPFVTKTYRWDPSEPVATRPLTLSLWTREGTICETLYCAHDLRKNVVSLFDAQGLRRASYQYDPYGNITSLDGDMSRENPYRFSSEHHDEDLGLVYYNYRHYNPTDGRWTSRDPIAEKGGWNLYGFGRNKAVHIADYLGLWVFDVTKAAGSLAPDFSPTLNRCTKAYFLAPENREKYGFSTPLDRYSTCKNEEPPQGLSDASCRLDGVAPTSKSEWIWFNMGERPLRRYVVTSSQAFTFGINGSKGEGSISIQQSEVMIIDGILALQVPCIVEYEEWRYEWVKRMSLCSGTVPKGPSMTPKGSYTAPDGTYYPPPSPGPIYKYLKNVTLKVEARKIVFETAKLVGKGEGEWELTGAGISLGPVSVEINDILN